jgi:hypothetical protein
MQHPPADGPPLVCSHGVAHTHNGIGGLPVVLGDTPLVPWSLLILSSAKTLLLYCHIKYGW